MHMFLLEHLFAFVTDQLVWSWLFNIYIYIYIYEKSRWHQKPVVFIKSRVLIVIYISHLFLYIKFSLRVIIIYFYIYIYIYIYVYIHIYTYIYIYIHIYTYIYILHKNMMMTTTMIHHFLSYDHDLTFSTGQTQHLTWMRCDNPRGCLETKVHSDGRWCRVDPYRLFGRWHLCAKEVLMKPRVEKIVLS